VGVPPARLFRTILQRRPVRQLPFRFEGVDHEPLQVRGLSLLETQEARDEAGNERAAIVARCLIYATGAFAFCSAEELLELPEGEFDALTRAVFSALDAFCPIPGRCDALAWRMAVNDGARDSSNATVVGLLGGAYDIAGGIAKPRIIDRPERFFGCAPVELSYGQLLCFRAARSLHEEQHRA